jgi:repressor LexA
MPNEIKLSDRQTRILDFIVQYLHSEKIPPSIRDIGEAVEITSTSVVNYNLAKLQDMGFINRTPEVSRGLSVNYEKLAAVNIAQPVDEERKPSLADLLDAMIRVPVLGHIQAGVPVDAPNARTLETAEEWVQLTAGMFGDPSRLFALRVQGDSMQDALVMDGDIVILRHQETAENGDMVAAWIDGDDETTLKYLRKNGNTIELIPANEKYDPIVRPANQVRINGKVVSVIRYMN